jgi:hypothetical protein
LRGFTALSIGDGMDENRHKHHHWHAGTVVVMMLSCPWMPDPPVAAIVTDWPCSNPPPSRGRPRNAGRGRIDMKTVIHTLLVVVMAAVPAVAQSTDKAKADAGAGAGTGDYYPLKVGTKWTYELDSGQPQKPIVTSVIAAEENAEGKGLARLEVYINGQKVPNSEHLMTNKDGVFRVRINNQDLNPPLCLLKYPLKTGQKWASKMTAMGEEMDVSCTQGPEEEVQVPAGKYKAVPSTIVTSQTKPDGGEVKIINTFWFVDNVGMVKQKMDLGGKIILMELSKYEPAPK